MGYTSQQLLEISFLNVKNKFFAKEKAISCQFFLWVTKNFETV
jgi:hypothetical protein